jgi:flagella basal body P-ring formation protein FlgA
VNIKGIVIFIACVFACFASPVSADTITVKGAARLEVGQAKVTLGDIATLDGPEAERWASLEIAMMNTSSKPLEIDVREIRVRLEGAGVNWAKVNLTGRKVVVRPGRTAEAGAPQAMASIALPGVATREQKAVEIVIVAVSAATLVNEATLRGMIANLMVSQLRVDPDQLRLTFQAEDAPFLGTLTSASRMEVQPLGSLASDRVEITVRTWAGSLVSGSRTVRVQPELAVQAAVLRRDVGKDETIFAEDVETVTQWVSPSVATQMADMVTAVGRIACKPMKAGEVLREKHIRRDALVKKGDQITVRCLVGGVAISVQAEARADGAAGEIIELRKLGERESFTAKVVGRSEAVLDLSRNSNG